MRDVEMNRKERLTRIQELVYELKVSDAMVRDTVTVGPDGSIHDLRDILRTHRISGVPVVEDDGLIGIVSVEDFIKWLVVGDKSATVADIMTLNPQVLYSNEPLVLAVNRFEESGFGRYPVLDRETGRLVGVLTKGDIIARVLRKLEIDYHEEEIYKHRASHIFEDIVADEVAVRMSSDVPSGDFDKAGAVSSGMKKALHCLNVHPQAVRRAAIACYEAEMNLIIYAMNGSIVMEATPERIDINVSDKGPGIPDVEKALTPGYSTAPDWVRELGFGAGMGLVNIRRCSDIFGIESEVGKGTHLKIGIKTAAD